MKKVLHIIDRTRDFLTIPMVILAIGIIMLAHAVGGKQAKRSIYKLLSEEV